MASAALEAHPKTAVLPLGRSWRMLVAARVCVDGGATRAELIRDLGVIAAHRLSPAELRIVIDREVGLLCTGGAATELRTRVTLLPTGLAATCDVLGIRQVGKTIKISWTDVRDVRLIAVALGMTNEASAKTKVLLRPDGLRAAILQQAYGLSTRSRTSPARLRGALAVVALQQAFGNSIKDAMDAGAGLSAKAGRLLAGQLAQKPRDFGTDARLITTLAAQAVGSSQTDADALRTAVLRKFVNELAPASSATEQSPRSGGAVAVVATVQAVARSLPVSKPASATRPDLVGFAKVIQTIARQTAEGWPGNFKAYISDVWAALQVSRPEWGLTEIEFKSMLAEAHRTGHIMLANADLKDRRSLPRVQQSALAFKNTVLHFVRVVD